MKTTVLFIDDDRRFIKDYADAVKAQDMAVHCLHGPDAALRYARDGKPADVVVWDMMMSPGKAFSQVDTDAGLTTGKHLYTAMKAHYPQAVFILLTNDELLGPQYARPEERSYVRYKMPTSPRQLAAFIKEIAPGQPGEEERHGRAKNR